MGQINCKVCGKPSEHHAKGMCYSCYRKQWTSPLIICKNCGRKKPHQAFGLCKTCHIKLHHYDKVKEYNHRKYHNIDLNTYQKVTDKCIICRFDKVVELHHLDGNRKNNFKENFIGLCPNHHRMLHNIKFRKDIFKILEDKLGRKLNISDLDRYKN